MAQPKIYADMEKRILSLIETMVDAEGLHELPEEVSFYLHTRRKALSSCSGRARYTASTHLTWITYHQNIAKNAALVPFVTSLQLVTVITNKEPYPILKDVVASFATVKVPLLL